jgi:small subunit ribosomal protein S17
MAKKKTDEAVEANDNNGGAETGAEPSLTETVIGAVAGAVGTVADTITEGAAKVAELATGGDDKKSTARSTRAEKIGIVASDKMTKTVTVRVDRVVKHPVYRKYVRKRKKFMAHDELGSKIGDKVRIIETRPMSARKRWRVVEIIQKAEL